MTASVEVSDDFWRHQALNLARLHIGSLDALVLAENVIDRRTRQTDTAIGVTRDAADALEREAGLKLTYQHHLRAIARALGIATSITAPEGDLTSNDCERIVAEAENLFETLGEVDGQRVEQRSLYEQRTIEVLDRMTALLELPERLPCYDTAIAAFERALVGLKRELAARPHPADIALGAAQVAAERIGELEARANQLTADRDWLRGERDGLVTTLDTMTKAYEGACEGLATKDERIAELEKALDTATAKMNEYAQAMGDASTGLDRQNTEVDRLRGIVNMRGALLKTVCDKLNFHTPLNAPDADGSKLLAHIDEHLAYVKAQVDAALVAQNALGVAERARIDMAKFEAWSEALPSLALMHAEAGAAALREMAAEHRAYLDMLIAIAEIVGLKDEDWRREGVNHVAVDTGNGLVAGVKKAIDGLAETIARYANQIADFEQWLEDNTNSRTLEGASAHMKTATDLDLARIELLREFGRLHREYLHAEKLENVAEALAELAEQAQVVQPPYRSWLEEIGLLFGGEGVSVDRTVVVAKEAREAYLAHIEALRGGDDPDPLPYYLAGAVAEVKVARKETSAPPPPPPPATTGAGTGAPQLKTYNKRCATKACRKEFRTTEPQRKYCEDCAPPKKPKP